MPIETNADRRPREIYSIWEGQESGITLKLGAGRPTHPGDEDAVKVLEFAAGSWNEACQVQCDHYGWGTYRPMDLEAGDGRSS